MPPKTCAVCGDKALGLNFSAVTCESCKAFFRRNALAKKHFTCPFNQNCEITVVTRRFCQRCRLKKCLDIGMKSENIMSEEDKLKKRQKIENNRAKRRRNELTGGAGGGGGEVTHESMAADSSGFDGTNDSHSCASFESATGSSSGTQTSALVNSSTGDSMKDVNPESMSGEEMVEFIVCDPDRACQAISKLMRTPAEALASLEKIINSQKDALRLISHLISYPGDALKIISKIMNSPFNALTVFTKFMSSPTDALEIISKVVSSPQDVLQFIRNLMDSPEDALDIMNKFMNTPAEALKILNKIFNGSARPHGADDGESNGGLGESPLQKSDLGNQLLNSMLQNSPHSSHGLLNSVPQPSQIHADLGFPTTAPLQSPVTLADGCSSIMPEVPPFQAADEMPSTSAKLYPTASPPILTAPTDYASHLRAAHLPFPSFASAEFPNVADNLNSLESVLNEMIRIEFQDFNDLPPEPPIKVEQQSGAFLHDNIMFDCNQQQVQQPICAPSNLSIGRDLNEAEKMKLRELKLASEALFYPVDDDLTGLMMADDRKAGGDTQQNSKLLQVINLTAVAIKRLIKMAKKITAFRDMCQEDQVALLKGGCTEMMIMRSVMTYDDDHNTWKIPHTKEAMSNIQAEVLKLAKGNVYEEHLKFISTFDEKWRMDENIILIMCAIVLFTPTRPRIIHTDVIKLEQKSYYHLLRRYLESVYPGCEAKSAFIKLIKKVTDVERLNQFIIGVYLNVNPSQVEPLLREIFDLKYHSSE